MNAVVAIAANTFREAVRHRVFYLLLVFSVLMIASSHLLGLITVGSQAKIVRDVGLAAVQLFGVLTAVLLGVGLVSGEIDRRTVFTVVAKPVRRHQFVVGKYLGLLAVLACNLGLMTLAMYVVLAADGWAPRLLIAVATIGVELALVAAIAVLFSCFSSTALLSTLFTFALVVAGHLSWSLMLLYDRLDDRLARTLCKAAYFLLPNLERLDFKTQVVHDLSISGAELGYAVLYGIAYSGLLVLIACAAFERRDFV